MCNHIYTADYSKVPRAMGRQCPYTALSDQLADAPPSVGAPIGLEPLIPLDPTGACLFHSKAVEWKKENHFRARFLRLLSLLDLQENGPGYYDFAEFIFVADEGGEKTPASVGSCLQKKTDLSGGFVPRCRRLHRRQLPKWRQLRRSHLSRQPDLSSDSPSRRGLFTLTLQG